MAEATPGSGIAKFGSFELDPETGELRRQGVKVHLQEQPARILALLLRSGGRLVTREELREALWPADTFVDFDHSLNTAVRKLRTALDDSADAPRYVETLAKRGYRFLVPVEWIGAPPISHSPPAGSPSSPSSPDSELETARRDAPRTTRILIIAAAGLAIAALLAWAMLRPSSSSETPHRALAVLPIENSDQATAYVSDGISEAIIDGLSNSPAIRVTARTSSFRYGTARGDLRAVGRELAVTAIVTGRLERRGDDYLLRLELVDTKDGAQLWARDYRHQVSDLDALRARAVSDLTLRLGVTSGDRPRPVKSAEAYDLYLRGRYHWNLRSLNDQLRAVEYFKRAVELDPEFAPAWAGLANVYGTLVGSTLVPGREKETQLASFAAAKRALELDPSNAEAYASLAASKLNYNNDYAGAERDFKRAIELNPSMVAAHAWYATLLARVGRAEEADREWAVGWHLDPYSPASNAARCFGRMLQRRYDDAIEGARAAESRSPEMRLAFCTVWAHLLRGDVAAAVEAQSRHYPERADDLREAVAANGLEGFLRMQLEILPASQEYERAIVHAMLGERDAAFEELERSFAMRRANTGFLWVDPRFDSIRDDPRFLDLALRLDLPQAKAAAAQGSYATSSSPPAAGRSGR